MNPITREESLLDGQDLTPITRKEQFIKRIYDKTQEIPEPITREEYFLKKAGEGTSPVAIEQLNVTENGTYSETGKAYSPVIVEVPAPTLITKTITENGTYNASEDNADGYSQVTVNVPYMEKKSASGDIASFSDGAGYPFLKVKANINPVQDLHGYDYPWVGGAGKNKINVPDITLADAGDIYNGAINLAAGTYTLSSSNTTTSVTVEGVSGTMPLTFTLANAITTIQITASGAGEFKNIQIESGSSATSYAPYSNICPISGFTGVNAQRVGKNLLNPNDVGYGNYTISPDGSYVNENKRIATSYIPCSAGQTYSVSGQVKATYSNKIFAFIGVAYFDKDYNYITRTASNQVDELISTAPQGAKYLRIFEEITNYEEGTAITPNVYNSVYKRQLELSATPTTYEPSEGITVSVSWQDEAGIVYGGYIDLVSGVLTVTMAGEIFDGSEDESWRLQSINSSGVANFYTTLAYSCKVSSSNFFAKSNALQKQTSLITVTTECGFLVAGDGDTLYLRLYSTIAPTVTKLRTWMPNNPVQVVCELATPQTYQLTRQQINTLIGQNNAWNNTNGQTEVEYFIPIE